VPELSLPTETVRGWPASFTVSRRPTSPSRSAKSTSPRPEPLIHSRPLYRRHKRALLPEGQREIYLPYVHCPLHKLALSGPTITLSTHHPRPPSAPYCGARRIDRSTRRTRTAAQFWSRPTYRYTQRPYLPPLPSAPNAATTVGEHHRTRPKSAPARTARPGPEPPLRGPRTNPSRP